MAELSLSLTVLDVALILVLPLVALLLSWLGCSVLVFTLVRLRPERPVAKDLETRVLRRRGTRSGRKLKLSLGYVALSLAGDNCVQATIMHRLASWLDQHRLGGFGRVAHAFARFLTHADISPRAEIGPGLYLYHGLGIVIGKGTTIGRNAMICQGVTLGGGPTVGDDVTLWAGAKVIGRVTIGDRSEVGANGVVVTDVPSDVIAVGVPATRFLPKHHTASHPGHGLPPSARA